MRESRVLKRQYLDEFKVEAVRLAGSVGGCAKTPKAITIQNMADLLVSIALEKFELGLR